MQQPNWTELILFVEDDRKVAAYVSHCLIEEGFETIVAYDGEQALKLLKTYNPTFVILDLMVSEDEGCEICRHLRRSCPVPILILTRMGKKLECISGISMGMYDDLTKPISPQELVDRIKDIFRRLSQYRFSGNNILRCGELALDTEKCKITRRGRSISATPVEFRLLHVLMAAPGRVFSRQEILDKVYPKGDNVVDRVIDVHIGNLRKKIEADKSTPKYILTVRGVGYQFRDGTSR
jgi:DNA-binding response OmpR family regulator